jgi:hypothetical protein
MVRLVYVGKKEPGTGGPVVSNRRLWSVADRITYILAPPRRQKELSS